jgi:hypothetical protein
MVEDGFARFLLVRPEQLALNPGSVEVLGI